MPTTTTTTTMTMTMATTMLTMTRTTTTTMTHFKLIYICEPNGGSMFGGCSCGILYTDGIPCHHMVAVVKSSRIEGLTATNSMPVWWITECWRN
jgi:hypothetical protein